MLRKTMNAYVLHELSSCNVASVTFDLWMNWSGFDIFALVMNFMMMHRFLNMLLLVFSSTQHYRCCFSRNYKSPTCQIQTHKKKYHICERWRLQLKHISYFPFLLLFLVNHTTIGDTICKDLFWTCNVQSLSICHQWC